ncbi:TetR family transcriptional regulator [Pseudomonas fluorescens]|nr:TetR family transcriptional regulator [Pseudomonas fluorescens]AOE76927.1 TetR family transcriptional regulator [Pseudomonas fluorescens]
MPMPNPIPRRRDAAVTRDAILLSARKVFARSGYDAATVHDIAVGAGLTTALVDRYFSSKEQLFADVVADTLARPLIPADGHLRADNLGRTLATALVSISDDSSASLEGWLLLLHSASSPRVAAIGRAQLENSQQPSMAATLKGAHAQERAALAMALVAGFQVMRQQLALSALVKADPQVLIDLLTPLFQQLVDAPST